VVANSLYLSPFFFFLKKLLLVRRIGAFPHPLPVKQADIINNNYLGEAGNLLALTCSAE